MTTAQARAYSKAFLVKSQEYLASAQDNLAAARHTAAAGDAVHAGICAKDAMVMALTGELSKHSDHRQAIPDLVRSLGKRPETPAAERALRELIAAKSRVEYGVDLMSEAQSTALTRRARALVTLAEHILEVNA